MEGGLQHDESQASSNATNGKFLWSAFSYTLEFLRPNEREWADRTGAEYA